MEAKTGSITPTCPVSETSKGGLSISRIRVNYLLELVGGWTYCGKDWDTCRATWKWHVWWNGRYRLRRLRYQSWEQKQQSGLQQSICECDLNVEALDVLCHWGRLLCCRRWLDGRCSGPRLFYFIFWELQRVCFEEGICVLWREHGRWTLWWGCREVSARAFGKSNSASTRQHLCLHTSTTLNLLHSPCTQQWASLHLSMKVCVSPWYFVRFFWRLLPFV